METRAKIPMTLITAEKLKKSYEWWEGNDRKLTRDEAKHYFDAMIDAQAAIKAELIVRCKDCKHYKQSAVADRKMCFRKDVDGVEVCYDFLPYDSCTYGERKDEDDALV